MNGSTTIGCVRQRQRQQPHDQRLDLACARLRHRSTPATRRPMARCAPISTSASSRIHVGGSGGIAAHTNRGFIQWAGFTFGQAVSFFDFYSFPATPIHRRCIPASTTGGGGWFVAGYTAQFGNGFSGTIAAEMRRQTQIIGQSSAPAFIVDWLDCARRHRRRRRLCRLPVAGHRRPTCASTRPGVPLRSWARCTRSARPYYGCNTVQRLRCGRPSGRRVGLRDRRRPQAERADDRPGRLLPGPGRLHPGCVGLCVLAADLGLQLVRPPRPELPATASSAMPSMAERLAQGNTTGSESDLGLGRERRPSSITGIDQWRTSVYGGYAEVSYNGQANAILCSLQGGGNGAGVGTAAVATAGCNNDWNVWWVGSRTQWNVTPDFYMGVDVMYTSLQSASTFNGILPGVDSGARRDPRQRPGCGRSSSASTRTSTPDRPAPSEAASASAKAGRLTAV